MRRAVQLTRGTGCRVLASFSNTLMRQLRNYATPPMIWAAAANAYEAGAAGFGIGDAHWTPNGWPWTEEEYNTLRLLGRPELLATVDKLYHVRSERGEGRTQFWLPGGSRPLPRTLTTGASVEVPFRIADDLARWQPLGRVKAVRLAVRFTNFQPSVPKISSRYATSRWPSATG